MPVLNRVISFPKGYYVKCRKSYIESLPKSLIGRCGQIVSEYPTEGRQCWEVKFKGWKNSKLLYLGEFICIPKQIIITYKNLIWIINNPKSHLQYYFCPNNNCNLFFDKVFMCSGRCPFQENQRKGIWCDQCGTMCVLEGDHSDCQRVDCECGASWFSTMSCVSELVRNS